MLGQSLRTTTYLCGSQRCCTCGSVRGIGEFLNDALVNCSDCHLAQSKPPGVFPIPKKVVGRDVACRYIIRYDGRTFWHQTDVDVAEVYLKNKHNDEVIAKVGSFDKFPKPIDTSDFDDIPF